MPDELIDKIVSIIAATKRIPRDQVSVDSSFEELGIDSLDGVNIMFELENEFNIDIPDAEAKAIRSVRQMVEGVRRLVEIRSSGDPVIRSSEKQGP